MANKRNKQLLLENLKRNPHGFLESFNYAPRRKTKTSLCYFQSFHEKKRELAHFISSIVCHNIGLRYNADDGDIRGISFEIHEKESILYGEFEPDSRVIFIHKDNVRNPNMLRDVVFHEFAHAWAEKMEKQNVITEEIHGNV